MRPIVVALAAAMFAVMVPTVAAAYDIPESAVRDYLDGVANADVGRVLETSAADGMAEGFRFERAIDRVKAYNIAMDGPVHSPFFADVQRTSWSTRLLGQARSLAYSLLAPDEFGTALEGSLLAGVDAPWATDVMDELDESRLASLTVVDIGLPSPDIYRTGRMAELNATQAETYGADEQTDRVVLIEFEGSTYVVGFTLLRYGDDWRITTQNSAVAGLPYTGAAQPMTPGEFESLISE